MTEPNQQPTQVQYPWRATLRTAVAATVGALSLLPDAAVGLHLDKAPAVVQVLAVTAAVTRFLALPVVHDWLDMYVPWLLPAPRLSPSEGQDEGK